MDPAEVMLTGFIGVAADSYRPLYCTPGLSLNNPTFSGIFCFKINRLQRKKNYNILPVNVCSFASILSTCFLFNQNISSTKKLAIGDKSHA
jgi:hypothetical protein